MMIFECLHANHISPWIKETEDGKRVAWFSDYIKAVTIICAITECPKMTQANNRIYLVLSASNSKGYSFCNHLCYNNSKSSCWSKKIWHSYLKHG